MKCDFTLNHSSAWTLLEHFPLIFSSYDEGGFSWTSRFNEVDVKHFESKICKTRSSTWFIYATHSSYIFLHLSCWTIQRKIQFVVFCVYNYIFSTKVLNFYDNSASRQFCSRRSSRYVVCIMIQIHKIHMPCRLLVLHAPLYTNIVDPKSGPFGGNLDKNAKNWLEQGALAIFWRFLTPGNKWCLDWSWFQTIYLIPREDKGDRESIPYTPYSIGNSSRVIFRIGIKLPRALRGCFVEVSHD